MTTESSLRGRNLALILLVLAYAMSMADRMVLSVLFEPIKAEFGLTDSQLGLLGGLSFALFYATLGIPIAMLADRGNRRNIIAASLALFSITTALCGTAWNFLSLVVFRMFVGVGEAGVNPASHSILADYWPPRRRARAMSMLSVGAVLGQIIGLVAGGFLAQKFGWRVTLYCLGVPGLLLGLLVFLFLREPARGQSETSVEKPSEGESGVPTSPPPALSDTVAFMWRNRAMRHLLAGGTLAVTVGYGITQWLPTFFMRTHELSSSQVGLMMGGLFGIVGMAGAIISGVLFDKLSVRKPAHGVWMLGITQVAVLPLSILAYTADALWLCLVFFILPASARHRCARPSR